MRTVVLGGAGNFGARIVRALRNETAIELIVGGRRSTASDATDLKARLDMSASDFAESLRALSPGLVVHCVGPFQGQGYGVAQAALAAGAHYLDLADGRQFVAGFAASLNAQAVSARRTAITGASTLPALSTAVVEHLTQGLAGLHSIDVTIAPGQRAARGAATLQGVFSYLGRPYPVWSRSRWHRQWGWMGLRTVQLDVGRRLSAACDVPDLTLFPERFPGVENVSFHAALEFRLQHLVLWGLAASRRLGLPLPVARWAVGLNRCAGLFDAWAGEKGGMRVCVQGRSADGRLIRRIWNLSAPATDGPEIPCMPAILLARRLACGELFSSGAYPCLGFLDLDEFAPEFARWSMTTRVVEEIQA
jgi:Saccharopine dehydrogenase NADP binding domain